MIVVVGPTASGKSQLAVRLAERFGGEVIGCDSMQVYRGFDCGTGKPSAELRARVPHHLIDVADPAQDFNLGDYVRRAEAILETLHSTGRRPILVGGTGLYLQGLLRGIFEGPRRDEALRERLWPYRGALGRDLSSSHSSPRRPVKRPRASRRVTHSASSARSKCILRPDGRLSELHRDPGLRAGSMARGQDRVDRLPRDVLWIQGSTRESRPVFAGGLGGRGPRLLASGPPETRTPGRRWDTARWPGLVRGEIDRGPAARDDLQGYPPLCQAPDDLVPARARRDMVRAPG